VESAGQYAPEELVPEAIKILLGKITEVEEGLDKLFEADTTQA
jgi:DNA-directed RNA polymerase I and III subunit RPAC1